MRFVQASVMLLGSIGLVALIAWYYSISAWAVVGGYGLQGLLFPAETEPGTRATALPSMLNETSAPVSATAD